MSEPGFDSIGDVVSAFGGMRSPSEAGLPGWRFPTSSGEYRVDQGADGSWTIGSVERGRYRADATFAVEREAARSLGATLRRSLLP